jgi:hypothetical protein
MIKELFSRISTFIRQSTLDKKKRYYMNTIYQTLMDEFLRCAYETIYGKHTIDMHRWIMKFIDPDILS